MTWAAADDAVLAPIVNNLDFTRYSVAYPGEQFDATALPAGTRSAPAVWIDVDIDYQPGQYLASGSGRSRWLKGVIDCAVMVEPIGSTQEHHAAVIDLFETYFNAASTGQLKFRVPEAYCTGVTFWDDRWMRRDWICPFWRFEDLGDAEETWLAGQSANQLVVTQASHGFTLGKWVGLASGSWALATTATPVRARGVVSAVRDVNTFTVTTGDIVKIPSHGLSGDTIYLSTAGSATSTAPALGTARQELGAVHDADFLVVQIGELTPG